MRDATPSHPPIVDDLITFTDRVRALSPIQQHGLLMGMVGRAMVKDRDGLISEIEWAEALERDEEE